MMKNEPVTVNKITIESTMNYNDTPVLHYKIEYPQFSHPWYQDVLDCINQWYLILAVELQNKYQTINYQEAVEQYEYTAENQFPFHRNEALEVYEITYNQDGIISLYHDSYTYTGGAHGNTKRQSETWDLIRECRVSLFGYMDHSIQHKAEVINNIREQIDFQIEKGEGWYFDDYPQLIFEYFNPESFYLTPDGMVLYYQQYDIAPYSSGMPEFIVQF